MSCIASGISDPTQKRAPLLHLAGPRVRDIFSNSIPADIRGGAMEYDKVIDILSEINKTSLLKQQHLQQTVSLLWTLDYYHSKTFIKYVARYDLHIKEVFQI